MAAFGAHHLAMFAGSRGSRPASAAASGLVRDQARGVQHGGVLDQRERDRLELPDRLSERLALPGVGDSLVQGGLPDGDGHQGDQRPGHPEAAHDLHEPGARPADEVLVGDVQAVEREAPAPAGAAAQVGVQLPAHAVQRGVEGADPARAGLARRGRTAGRGWRRRWP